MREAQVPLGADYILLLPSESLTKPSVFIFESSYKVRRLLRVGMAIMEPWLDKRRDEKGKIMTSPAGVTLYEGFCMDFLEKLSEYANFDYQIVVQGDSRVPGMISFWTCWVFAHNLENQIVF